MNQKALSLSKALEEDRLEEFIEQAERSPAASGPAKVSDFDKLVKVIVKPTQSKDQTSHSACDDDSLEK